VKKLLLIVAAAVAALVLAAQALAAPPKFITDTLAPGGGTSATQQAQGYRFITDTLAPGGGGSAPTVVGRGFSWSDAGLGVLSGVGVTLVALGAVLVTLRRHNVAAA
jgi:hypothetical protein